MLARLDASKGELPREVWDQLQQTLFDALAAEALGRIFVDRCVNLRHWGVAFGLTNQGYDCVVLVEQRVRLAMVELLLKRRAVILQYLASVDDESLPLS